MERDRVPLYEAHARSAETCVQCSKPFCHANQTALSPQLSHCYACCGESIAPAFSAFTDAFTNAPLLGTEPERTRTNHS